MISRTASRFPTSSRIRSCRICSFGLSAAYRRSRIGHIPSSPVGPEEAENVSAQQSVDASLSNSGRYPSSRKTCPAVNAPSFEFAAIEVGELAIPTPECASVCPKPVPENLAAMLAGAFCLWPTHCRRQCGYCTRRARGRNARRPGRPGLLANVRDGQHRPNYRRARLLPYANPHTTQAQSCSRARRCVWEAHQAPDLIQTNDCGRSWPVVAVCSDHLDLYCLNFASISGCVRTQNPTHK